MEINSRRRNNSLSSDKDDKFSFPVIIETTLESHDQFEFESHITTPASPNSPADHLFYNGKLLPHVFPTIQTCTNNFSYSRSTSRTSSISSKDSFMSSRSNSTNSSRSCSARTSTSDQSSFDQRKLSSIAPSSRNYVRKDKYKPVMSKPCQYGSSQKWQFIAATPVLMHQGSRSKKVNDVLDRKGSKKLHERAGHARKKSWFGMRVLRGFVSACKQCHAIDDTSNVMVEM